MKTKTNRHILLVISGLALATVPGYAQNNGPLPILWQKTYGPGIANGVGWALPRDFVQTPDGGFIIAGAVGGPTNNIRTATPCRVGEFWVIKIDAQGQRQWDRSCGGGYSWNPGQSNPGDDALRVFLEADGGFLLAGFSASQPDCCKTAPLRPPGSSRPWNLWVVRYGAEGGKLWDQSYLPDDADVCYGGDFEPTADGAYLACGSTGGAYGVVKFDAEGQQLWTKNLGCSYWNGYTMALRIRETADGGFVVAGFSDSPPCAGKQAPFYGGSDPHGVLGSDIWVVRADAQQNKLWDKSYGGRSYELATDIHPLSDGGFMVFGASTSAPVTDPSQGTRTSRLYGGADYWVVRLDSDGNQLWDKSYGGSNHDVCTHAEPMPDGGWLLSGTSRSLPGGNKTSPRFGSSDFWLVRIDDQGNKLWEQSFGGTGQEGIDYSTWSGALFMRERIKRTTDGGFLLTGYSMSSVSGLKTAPLVSQGDFWVLKLGPEPPSLRGEVTAEGKFQLCLIAPPEFCHNIQASADLVTWEDLGPCRSNPTGKEYWTDPDKRAHRYYRAVRR